MTLAVIPSAELAPLDELLDQAADYLAAARSPATLRAYVSDVAIFEAWCSRYGLESMPADPRTVAAFVASEASTVKPGTVARRLAAIRWHHEQDGLQSPTTHPQVRQVLAGVRRVHHSDPEQRRPIYLDDLAAMVAGLDASTMRGLRDRALLVAGWWSACRRSELSAATVADLDEHPEGFILRVRRSKTDQEGRGRLVPLAYHSDEAVCPVRAIRAWLPHVDGGAVFRSISRWDRIGGPMSGTAIATVVKQNGARIGIDPATLGGHSLRAGFVSEADRRGVPDRVITSVTGHKSPVMLTVYSRPRSVFADGPARWFATSEADLSPSDAA